MRRPAAVRAPVPRGKLRRRRAPLLALAGAFAAALARAADVDSVLKPLAAPRIDEEKAAPCRRLLEEHVRRFVEQGPYAPLLYVAGKSGVAQVFSQSDETVTALSRAYPYLSRDLQRRVKTFLLREIQRRPPFEARACYYQTSQGRRRERFAPRPGMTGRRPPPAEIGALYGVWLLAENTGSYEQISRLWKPMRRTLSGKLASGFSIDPVKGHWAMNRVVAGLIGYIRLAERFGDDAAATEARSRLGTALDELRRYWSSRPTFPERKYFAGVTPARGDVLLIYGSCTPCPHLPHASTLACLSHMRGEILRCLSEEPVRSNVLRLLRAIDRVGPSWYVSWAERWMHRGENALGSPDESPGIMLAKAHIEGLPAEKLAAFVDVPLCEGDFYYVERLVTAIETCRR